VEFTYQRIDNPTMPYRLTEFEVFFKDLSCLDAIASVLDEKGAIRNFPGIVKDERWEMEHHIGQCYDVRFEAQFYPLDEGKFLMLWMIQPDGWYWADEDGFGRTRDNSIVMYAVVGKDGEFEGRFALFSIGRERYCHEYDACMKA